jgi:hypothetical protein
MSASPQATVVDSDPQRLLPIYLSSLRQRFKAEINRLSNGDMARLLRGRPDAAALAFPLTYLYGWHWLRHNVPEPYREGVLATFRNPQRLFLMRLLIEADSPRDFLDGYFRHWEGAGPDGPVQQAQATALLRAHGGGREATVEALVGIWDGLGLFTQTYKVAYAGLARQERDRYGEMLGEADQTRLALVDALPDPGPERNRRFAKLGIIPAMGCPQTCRHCMFIWRPLKPTDPDPGRVYRTVDGLTDNVLFTGGDLTRHMDAFYDGIRAMRHVTTFAILLNGDFANDPETTETVIGKMAAAIEGRPAHWPKARVLLQISFDEFHQEVIVDKRGRLRERIPVAKIANIVETAPRYHEQVQLALLHKQTGLNFSMDVLHKGVFARLVNELGERGHQVQVLSTAPSSRLKRHPLTGEQGRLLKDASFVLAKYPRAPILLTSSTIDGYGRAELMEAGETVKERELLQQVLTQGPPPGEAFDIDLMFWFNGWATLFNAVHMCLGDLYQDGLETILARQRKDPLSHALHRFDRRLLDLYAERRPDLDRLLEKATGPHHLFHMLTEDAEVRLHMTRRLIALGVLDNRVTSNP